MLAMTNNSLLSVCLILHSAGWIADVEKLSFVLFGLCGFLINMHGYFWMAIDGRKCFLQADGAVLHAGWRHQHSKCFY